MRNFFKFTFIILTSLCAKAQVPTATILGVAPYNCSGKNIFFAGRTTGFVTSYKWSVPPNRGATIVSKDNDSTIVCSFSLPGVYTLSLSVSDGSVSSTVTKLINVTRSANASFNASLVATGYPNQLSLTDYSTNALKNYWIYSGNAPKDSSAFVLKDYPSSGSYTVSLAALGRNGCNDTLSYEFRISDSSGITLPNVFTPNEDGVNDIYKPIAKGISILNAYVYNRYGTLITSWDRVNGFWDGSTTSALECRSGEYFIILEATGFDGKTYKLKSSITLIR